jgi:hypothetical protein
MQWAFMAFIKVQSKKSGGSWKNLIKAWEEVKVAITLQTYQPIRL